MIPIVMQMDWFIPEREKGLLIKAMSILAVDDCIAEAQSVEDPVATIFMSG